MLDSLRNMASGWVAQLLLAILVISFAVWGVSDIFTGFGQNSVGRVGATEITLREYQRAYTQASRNVSANNPGITPEQMIQGGLPALVLESLIINATVLNEAQRMGLGLSDDRLFAEIRRDPAYLPSTGVYDRAYLSQILSSVGMTDNEFVLDRRAAYTRAQLKMALASGNVTPDTYLRAYNDYVNQVRKISFVQVAAPAAADIADPSDADLAAYFTANMAKWKAPEYRAVSFVVLSPGEIALPDQVSDADAKNRYDATPGAFFRPGQRQVQQIVFKDKAEAEAALADLKAGKAFEDIAKARNLKPEDYDLGIITKDQILDPTVAAVAFATPEKSFSQVIDGRFGPVIVNVPIVVVDDLTVSFEDSRADIKAQIAMERAADDIQGIRDSIEDERAGGKSLTDAAGKFGLKVTKVAALSQGGIDDKDNPVPGLPVAVLAGAFTAKVGQENDPVEPDTNSFAWYEVTGITPPRDRTLDEVKAQVLAAWKDEQRQKALDARTAEIKKRVDAGETLAAVAVDQMLMLETADNLSRGSQTASAVPPQALNAIFSTEKGKAAITIASVPMTAVVLVVDDIVDPPLAAGNAVLLALKKDLNDSIMEDLFYSYGEQVRDRSDVRRNQAAVAQVLGITPTP